MPLIKLNRKGCSIGYDCDERYESREAKEENRVDRIEAANKVDGGGKDDICGA